MTDDHWRNVWQARRPEEVTWYQPDPARSLRLIGRHADNEAAVVDIGGGASRLVDRLVAAGYHDVTVVDIVDEPLAAARRRLGSLAATVNWIVGDVTDHRFDRRFDVWHDRAVFHFLVDADDRDRYLATVDAALAVGGLLVVATFGPDGPDRCSGLPVRRYDADLMQVTLGDRFRLLDEEIEEHVAPSGTTQQFWYGAFRRVG